jgi:NAD dependent epimerase/dehydratase family enzyme
MTATLARVLHRPAKLPVPTPGLKVALGGELVDEMLLGGQRVLPAKLQRAGYEFRHPELEAALRAMLERPAA